MAKNSKEGNRRRVAKWRAAHKWLANARNRAAYHKRKKAKSRPPSDPHAADRYRLIVYWSDEDNCWIGQCPDFFFGGTHGDDPVKVFRALRKQVREMLVVREEIKADGQPG
jgi:predicted RNase H-like HicB family nuclease